MALLAGKLYDPGTVATASCASLLAMTAFDTTNLRLTFTAPANGNVLVRLRGVLTGATTNPQTLLGVLDGSTVRGRQVPQMGRLASNVANQASNDAVFLVTGLTPGNSYTWDAAYGVEVVVASTIWRIGGPNDTTTSNAAGGFGFEVWETRNLLAGVMYDPASAVSKAVSSLLAMTAFDTTNLRVTFTTAAGGQGSTSVLVKVRVVVTGGTGSPAIHLGVLDGATVKCRQIGVGGFAQLGNLASTDRQVYDAAMLVTGLTPSTSYTWDAAYGVDVVLASGTIQYGGPNNTTTNDAWGGISFEVWAA